MIKPETLQIGSYTFNINYNWEGRKNDWGVFEYKEQRIGFRPDLTEQGLRETFIHELLHGAWYLAALGDDLPEEKIITSLSLQLATIFHQNPELKDTLFI